MLKIIKTGGSCCDIGCKTNGNFIICCEGGSLFLLIAFTKNNSRVPNTYKPQNTSDRFLRKRNASLTGTEIAGSPRRFAAMTNRIRSPENKRRVCKKTLKDGETCKAKI